MTEAGNLWFDRVEKAIQELHKSLEEHRRNLIEQAAIRTELRLAILKAQIANDQAAMSTLDYARAA